MQILLVEDNFNIATGLKFSFEKNNYEIEFVSTYKEAITYLENKEVQLIILDITLPDGNGFELYENTIKKKNIPTIFLTAKDDENDIVKGLDIGAEDYITKPFSTKELLARVNKVLLRNQKNSTIKIQDIVVDIDKMEIYKNGKKVILTNLEFKILNLLILNINKVVKRNTILDLIWESTGNDVDDHTVTVYLKRIREKLGTNIITTVKGVGYIIDEYKK